MSVAPAPLETRKVYDALMVDVAPTPKKISPNSAKLSESELESDRHTKAIHKTSITPGVEMEAKPKLELGWLEGEDDTDSEDTEFVGFTPTTSPSKVFLPLIEEQVSKNDFKFDSFIFGTPPAKESRIEAFPPLLTAPVSKVISRLDLPESPRTARKHQHKRARQSPHRLALYVRVMMWILALTYHKLRVCMCMCVYVYDMRACAGLFALLTLFFSRSPLPPLPPLEALVPALPPLPPLMPLNFVKHNVGQSVKDLVKEFNSPLKSLQEEVIQTALVFNGIFSHPIKGKATGSLLCTSIRSHDSYWIFISTPFVHDFFTCMSHMSMLSTPHMQTTTYFDLQSG